MGLRGSVVGFWHSSPRRFCCGCTEWRCWLPFTAVLRAAVQLAAISVLLSGANQWPWLVLGFIALMLSTASWTGASRAEGLPGGRRNAVISVVAGGMSSLLLTLLVGLISPTPQHVVAIAGSVIGNAMNIVTLTSRRIRADLDAHRGEVEGWLALGATRPSRPHGSGAFL
nr:ABC transporter permease [Arachnia propionica]